MEFRARRMLLFFVTILLPAGFLVEFTNHLSGISSGYSEDPDFKTDLNTVFSSKKESITLSQQKLANHATDRVKTEQYRRIKHLHDACADQSLSANRAIRLTGAAKQFSSAKYNFSYYKIPKAGCSVWTQIFAVLNSASNESGNIFYKQRGYIHSALQKKVQKENGPRGPYVIPSRNPYSRLYSGYMDKIFLSLFPREENKIINSQRKHVLNQTIKCTKDATFPEFLKTILDDVKHGQRVNRHWAPITSIFKPCAVDVLAIAKQETFSSDVEFILKKVGVTNDKLEVIHDALNEHRLEATLPSYIKEVLNHGTCKTKQEVAQDLWYTFKVNGYLREDSDFPHVKTKNFTITPENLTKLVFKAISENPLTSEESRRQKRRALINAYKDVDEKTLRGLQEVYKRDFALFDYSTEPPRDLNIKRPDQWYKKDKFA